MVRACARSKHVGIQGPQGYIRACKVEDVRVQGSIGPQSALLHVCVAMVLNRRC